MKKGAMINKSKKLGVAKISLNETELVLCVKRFPKCTWFRYFRLDQGAEDKKDILL